MILALLLTSVTVLEVPQDHPTIQEAINAATPGEVITVSPGVFFLPISLTKPVSLIGSGPSTVLRPIPGQATAPTVVLSGAGGVAVLTDMTIEGGRLEGQDPESFGAIVGGGFDYLALVRVTVRAVWWQDVAPTGDTIKVGCPLLAIDCNIRSQGQPATDAMSELPSEDYLAKPAIVSPRVVLIRSSVSVGWSSWKVTAPAPEECSRQWNPGAPGIVSSDVYTFNSSVSGGPGGTVRFYWSSGITPDLECPQADGKAVVGPWVAVGIQEVP